MHRRAPTPGPALTADEFARRLGECSRLLWTIAAGVLGDRTQAEDVVQEAAIVGLGRLEAFESGTRFEAWMGRIVRLVALNHLRKARRRATHPVDPSVLDERPHPGLPPYPEEFDDALAGALGELRPIARTCLLLKTVMELEYSEISATLGIPPGTAMSHVHRARRTLRRKLEAAGPGAVETPTGSGTGATKERT